MTSVFILQHCYTSALGNDHVKIIGTYSSRDEVEGAVARLRTLPGFSEHPHIVDPLKGNEGSGFYIDEYRINEDHWTEGFVSV